MAAPFSKESLERIVAECQAEKLRFKDKKVGLVDLTSASAMLQAEKVLKPETWDKLMHQSAERHENFVRRVSLIMEHMH